MKKFCGFCRCEVPEGKDAPNVSRSETDPENVSCCVPCGENVTAMIKSMERGEDKVVQGVVGGEAGIWKSTSAVKN
jgi:dissimilatory sulfite reductase (desulfoviridin) alpha/beta subunit